MTNYHEFSYLFSPTSLLGRRITIIPQIATLGKGGPNFFFVPFFRCFVRRGFIWGSSVSAIFLVEPFFSCFFLAPLFEPTNSLPSGPLLDQFSLVFFPHSCSLAIPPSQVYPPFSAFWRVTVRVVCVFLLLAFLPLLECVKPLLFRYDLMVLNLAILFC